LNIQYTPNFAIKSAFRMYIFSFSTVSLHKFKSLTQGLPTFLLLFLLILQYTITVSSLYAISDTTTEPISISQARAQGLGSSVTVSGWVTVANQFGGPSYIQDSTAGIAVFLSDFSANVAVGDSVVVSGTLTEIGNTPFTTGTGLLQIGSNVSYSVYADANQLQQPVTITLTQLNSGNFEGQLVEVISTPVLNINSTTSLTGTFRGNQNYTIRDREARAQLRIASGTDIVDSPAPSDWVDLVGVVGRFRGTYQLIPRSLDDITLNPYVKPGSDLPVTATLDVATWNIEWFGDPSNGPSNTEQQFQNVKRVIEETQFDIYALQEISNPQMFQRLVNELQDYRGFISPTGLTQRLAYLFRTSTVDSVRSGVVATAANWAGGRSPLLFEFDINLGGQPRRIAAINLHAKAFSTEQDYNKRVADANILKQYTDSRRRDTKMIVLGDYNDDVTVSIWNGAVSPYQIFVDDPGYEIVTRALSIAGETSFRDRSMIDHITISELLYEYHIDGAEMVLQTGFITNYLGTTSDHFPVITRFFFGHDVGIDLDEPAIPATISLLPNYPNPFNPSTTLRFTLNANDTVTLDVYDITGRLVSRLLGNQFMPAGEHELLFDGSNLSSGVYVKVLRTASGVQTTGRMTLIK
jgi:endonuclease/exonuclease/phosphatase family metal-dependent hydrolase